MTRIGTFANIATTTAIVDARRAYREKIHEALSELAKYARDPQCDAEDRKAIEARRADLNIALKAVSL